MISESVTDVAGSKMRSDVITFEFRYAAILWMDAVAIDILKAD